MMWTRVPDLLKGSGYVDLVGGDTQIDPASEQHVLNPAIAARRLLWLSTVLKRLTSPRRLIPACESRTQARTKKKATQLQMYYESHEVGVSQTVMTAKLL